MSQERFNPHYDQPDVDPILRLAMREVGLRRAGLDHVQPIYDPRTYGEEVEQVRARMTSESIDA